MFYVQYAHARAYSVLRHAHDMFPSADLAPAALAKASLERLTDPAELALIKRMADWPKKHKIVGDVRGRGLMIGVEIVKDQKTREYGASERDPEEFYFGWLPAIKKASKKIRVKYAARFLRSLSLLCFRTACDAVLDGGEALVVTSVATNTAILML